MADVTTNGEATSTHSNEIVIEAKELSKIYGGKAATQNVSFEVRRGEVVGFLGPNGAGKTTTMKILTCFIAPTSGSAKVNGADIFSQTLEVRKSIGYLPESTPLYTEMRVDEYLEFMGRIRGLRAEALSAAVKRVVEETSLGDVTMKPIRALSKGFRQRVGLAQALIHRPPILILDEPMSGLDPNQAVEIRELITNVGRERTVILSTHNLAEVQTSCNRVLIISGGRIVADDKPEALVGKQNQSITRVTFLVAGERDSALESGRRALAGLTGVESINEVKQTDAKEISFELVAKSNDDLRSSVFSAAVENKLTLIGLTREARNLEAIFRDLTIGAKPAASVSKSAKSEPDSTSASAE